MEESFQQFLQRPENRTLVEAQQRKEALQAVKAKEKASTLNFRRKVLTADLEAQKALVPFLKNSVLRRIIQTFTNDAQGDISKWACNPEVIRLLTEAKRLMDEGHVTETEMEAKLVAQLNMVTLDMENLVLALNEHLLERCKGNERYRSGDYEAAKQHYNRAKAIVDLVKGQGPDEQAEIDSNRVAVLLNLAALFLGTREYSSAEQCCTEALQTDSSNGKALIRRAKADTKLHNYKAAQRDLEQARLLDSPGPDWDDAWAKLQKASSNGHRKDAALFGKMIQ